MKKNTILLAILLFSGLAYAQEGRVGINTTEPKATLDVEASPTDLTKTDGFIAPRLTGNQLKNKDSNYTNNQTGAIVYATEAASPTTAKTINVTEAGYYYFDSNVWQKMKGTATGTEPWRVQNTTTEAAENTENIYQQGKVAVGFTSADAVSGKQFEVKGEMKAKAANSAGSKSTTIETRQDYIELTADDQENWEQTASLFLHPTSSVLRMQNPDWSKLSEYYLTRGLAYTNNIDTDLNLSAGFSSDVVSSNNGVPMSGTSMIAADYWGNRYSRIETFTTTPDYTADNYNRINLDISDQSTPYMKYTHMHMDKKGFVFSLKFADTNNKIPNAYYRLPTSDGTRGQVLVTHGYSGALDGTNTNKPNRLVWRNAADVLLLKSPDGNCWKLTVSNTGVLGTTSISCTIDFNPLDYGAID